MRLFQHQVTARARLRAVTAVSAAAHVPVMALQVTGPRAFTLRGARNQPSRLLNTATPTAGQQSLSDPCSSPGTWDGACTRPALWKAADRPQVPPSMSSEGQHPGQRLGLGLLPLNSRACRPTGADSLASPITAWPPPHSLTHNACSAPRAELPLLQLAAHTGRGPQADRPRPSPTAQHAPGHNWAPPGTLPSPPWSGNLCPGGLYSCPYATGCHLSDLEQCQHRAAVLEASGQRVLERRGWRRCCSAGAGTKVNAFDYTKQRTRSCTVQARSIHRPKKPA